MSFDYKLKDLRLYLIFCAVIIVALGIYSQILGIIAGICFLYIIYNVTRRLSLKNDRKAQYFDQISQGFDTITKKAIFNMPFPLVVADEKSRIIWYNSLFGNLFEKNDLLNEDLSLLLDLDFDEINKSNGHVTFPLKLKDKNFSAFPNSVDFSNSPVGNERATLIYFVEDTQFFKLQKKYIDEYPIIAKIEVDNYEEAMDSTPSSARPQLIAEIDSIIRDYFEEYDAFVRKMDRDLYLVCMDFKSLKAIKEKRFDILDDLRDLDRGNTIPITLSIGVCSFGLTFRDANLEADTCLDLALGRGGDQAVVKVKDNYEFFGGKSKAVEKRNKVKARVLGMALKQIIDGSNDLFIMGHKNADMDAIGASIGVLRAAINRNKKGYIVLEKSNPSIDNLIDRMREEEPELYKSIISKDKAKSTISTNSLLVLVDNHKPSLTECPELLEFTNQVVVIDHHRRGKEFVENPVLTYIEPYASSTCELITEMLTYMSDDLNLTHFEADAIMSGIVVDTKNFSNQTGVRTFEAASILKRAGADMQKVKKLFEDDLDTLLYRAEVVHNTKIVHENIAISRLEKDAENSVLIAAQAADSLLDINNIKASFVMTIKDGKTHISGRSRGEISVQLILEKLGGGGHLNMAGAQIETADLDEAYKVLTDAIDQYLLEEKKGEKLEDNTVKR